MGRDYTQFHPPTPACTTAPSLITMGQDYTAVLTLGDGTTFTERIQSPFHSMHSVHPPTPPCTTAPSLITMGRDYTTVLTLGDGTTFTEHIHTMGRDYTAVLTLGSGTTFTGRSLGGNTATETPLPLMLAGGYTTVGLPDDVRLNGF
ncbi:unnamed protein product [Closterium sp. NIES-65]|nr:unnamed protein product [Closterium sp. NIES-65]